MHEDESESIPHIVHILHLEDSEQDREIVRLVLKDDNIACEISAVQTRAEFVRSLQRETWDLILSDHSLPSFNGLEALAIAGRCCPDTPFIFFTGTMGEDTAVECLHRGATDYVLKNSLGRLGPSVRRAINERTERLQRHRTEAELNKSEERLRFLAYHDSLTGLPNRALFQERVPLVLADAERRGERIALLHIDLDNFKTINESLGHTAGDLVLQQVAERLKNSARNEDTVAHLGGDEFAVVVSAIQESTDAGIAADRIKNRLAVEFKVQGKVISISCSIGISIFPEDGRNIDALFKNADAALFSAKDEGRNRWQFFVPEMNRRAVERLSVETALRNALKNDQFFLEYQPQIEVSTGRIVGAEALLRWQHPEEGLIPPNRFIPVAESTGEIIPIGAWVLKTACAQAKQWQDEGMPLLSMAVNISAAQVHHGSLLKTVKDILDETGLAPEYLELETTESLLLTRGDNVTSQMRGLRELGVRMAIDDFGTGYSSFSYVRRFRFDKLKIDGSFIQNLITDPDDTEIVSGIIGFGATLKMEVIAECVETKEQLEILGSLGCDQIQGYYFSRPLRAAAFGEMLRSNTAPSSTRVRTAPNSLSLSRKKLEMAITLSEALMENLPAVVCIFNSSRQVRRWNKNFLGYPAEDIFQTGLKSAVAPESLAEAQRIMREAFEHGRAEGEASLIAKNGAKIPCYLTGARIMFEDEPCILGIAIDISTRVKTEEDLRRSKEEYDALFEGISDAIFVNEVGQGFTPGKFIRVNKAACDYLGYTAEELYALSPRDINDPESFQDIFADLKKVPPGMPILFETKHIAKDGRKIPVEINGRMIQFKSGDMGLAIVRNISDRKQVEEMLQNSENKYRALFEGAADAYLVTSDKCLLDCNAAALRMFGYSTKSEFIAMHPGELSPQFQPDGMESIAASKQKIASALRNGSGRFEWVHKRRNGEFFPAEVCLSAIVLNGSPALLGTVHDLTERKRAESALRESEERLRSLINSTPDWVWEVDAQGLYTYVSPRVKDLLGYVAEEVIGRKPFDLMPAEEAERVAALFATVAQNHSAIECVENVNLHKDGRQVVLETSATPIFDSNGLLCGYRGIDRDITERKRIAVALEKSEAGLKEALQAAHMGVWSWTQATGDLAWDENFYRIAGHDPPSDFRQIEQHFTPQSWARLKPMLESTCASGTSHELDVEMIRPDGSTRWIVARIRPLQEDGGRIVGLRGTAQNITERKQAEVSLALFRTLVDQVSDTIEVIEPQTLRYLDVNQRACLDLGYTRNEMLSMSTIDVDLHMNDLKERIDQGMREKGFARFESEHRRKDGSIFPVEVSLKLVQLDRPYIVSTAHDISELKSTMQRLRSSEAGLALRNRLANIFLSVPDDRMFSEVLDVVLEGMHSSLGFFGFIDEQGMLVVPSLRGQVWEECKINGKSFTFSREVLKGPWGRAILGQTAIYSNQPGHVPDGHVPIRRYVLAPMLHQDLAIGVLAVANKATNYDESDTKQLDGIAGYLAPLLHAKLQKDAKDKERRRAEEIIESLARTDPLTGLANRRVLEETLPRETARAKRLKESLAAIFADLDDFKSINDRFGHRAGDQVLTCVGSVLKSQLRSYALASRFGGDEFVLLLPGTAKDGAMIVAERIREKVAASTVPDCPSSFTLSLGVAVFEGDESGERLIARADAALYQAKQKGGDRVACA